MNIKFKLKIVFLNLQIILIIKNINCQFFLDIQKNSSSNVLGVLKYKINKSENIFEYNPYLLIQHTNYYCKELNYDSIHSSSFQCKLDKIFNVHSLVIQNRYFCCNV